MNLLERIAQLVLERQNPDAVLASCYNPSVQNRYTGDIGDFGKYALLRALTSNDLRLGINWYLNPDEEGNGDGGFIEYPELRECDPPLHDALAEVIRRGDRRVAAVENDGILQAGTLFYSAPLTFRNLPTYSTAARRARREQWLRCALAATVSAGLVFMDPDNGIAGKSAVGTSNVGQKYVFLEELAPYIARGQSVVVYHHQTRERGGVAAQIVRLFAELETLGGAGKPLAMIFRRRSVRVYFVLPAPAHESRLRERAREFVNGPWGRRGHFELA